jgi:hypothetical protein
MTIRLCEAKDGPKHRKTTGTPTKRRLATSACAAQIAVRPRPQLCQAGRRSRSMTHEVCIPTCTQPASSRAISSTSNSGHRDALFTIGIGWRRATAKNARP